MLTLLVVYLCFITLFALAFVFLGMSFFVLSESPSLITVMLLMLAAGLFALAEFVEENVPLAKRVLRSTIYAVLLIHFLLVLFSDRPQLPTVNLSTAFHPLNCILGYLNVRIVAHCSLSHSCRHWSASHVSFPDVHIPSL